MQIRVYIEPNGDVTITTLIDDLVPVAYALDRADLQMQRWLDFLSEGPGQAPGAWTGEMERIELDHLSGLEGKADHGRLSTHQVVGG